MSALIELKAAAVLVATCSACGRHFTAEDWERLERRGYVGHWRAHRKLYAIEMRQCPCNGTMGIEVENPPMTGKEEVTDE